MKWKFITIFAVFMLIATTPSVSAATVEMRGWVRFERENVTANNTIPLNLSNPDDLKKYSPVYNFWPSINTGILIDSTLPPDILIVNGTKIMLNATFRISSQLAADGASLFEMRLPVVFKNISNISSISLSIYHHGKEIMDYYFDWSTARDYGESLEKYNVSYYNITYINYSFSLLYLTLRTLIYSDMTYNYTLDVESTGGHISGYFLAAGFDLFRDNVTGFTLNGEKYNGDAMCGFRVLDMVSNGFGEFYMPYMEKEYVLNQTYSGSKYVSFAIGLISSNSDQNVTIRIETLDGSGTLYNENSSKIHITSVGPIMIYGHAKVNMSSTNKLRITIYSDVDTGIDVITDGEDSTPIIPNSVLVTKSIVEVQKTYLKWYMDVVVSDSKYYYPYFVKLPGTWQENVELVLQEIGAGALIPVVLTGLYTGQLMFSVINFTLHAAFLPWIIAGQYLKALIDAAASAFRWFIDLLIHFFMDIVAYWLWIAELVVAVVINIFFWLIAAVLGNSMVNAMIRLPKDGINAVFEEFGKGLSVVNQILTPVKNLAKKIGTGIMGVIK